MTIDNKICLFVLDLCSEFRLESCHMICVSNSHLCVCVCARARIYVLSISLDAFGKIETYRERFLDMELLAICSTFSLPMVARLK